MRAIQYDFADPAFPASLARAFPFVLGHEIYFHLGGLDLYPETLKSAHSKA